MQKNKQRKVKKSIWNEYKTTKALVKDVLREEERARNSDSYLQWYIWREKQGLNLNDFQDGYNRCVNAETIRRVRQEIQNDEGKFLPTDPKVIERREIKEEAVWDYYGEYSKPYQELRDRRQSQ